MFVYTVVVEMAGVVMMNEDCDDNDCGWDDGGDKNGKGGVN